MVQLKIKGLEKLVKLANKFPAVAEKYCNTAISRSLVRIWGKEKLEAPVNTGNLRDNWELKVGRFTGFLRSNASYSSAIEYGTRPHFVSAETLRPWAVKRGLNPWAVSKSIARKGTKANPFFKRALSGVESGVNIEFQNAIDGTLKELNKLTD